MGKKKPRADQVQIGLAIRLLADVSHHTARSLEAALADQDMTLPQYAVLLHMSAQPTPHRISDLTKVLAVNQPFVTKSLAKFEKLGLVEAIQHPDDRRSRLFKLTVRGIEQASLLHTLIAPDARTILAGCSEKDLDRLNRILGSLLQAFQTRSPQTD